MKILWLFEYETRKELRLRLVAETSVAFFWRDQAMKLSQMAIEAKQIARKQIQGNQFLVAELKQQVQMQASMMHDMTRELNDMAGDLRAAEIEVEVLRG